jgi:dihydroneopterin aldolase
MSVIYIRDLVIEAKHGYRQEEKDNAQRFKINVELTIDTAKAGRSDDLADTLNWSGLRDTIVNTVQNNSFDLMERLAQELVSQILKDGRVQKLVVSIDKPDAFSSGVPGIRLEAGQPSAD